MNSAPAIECTYSLTAVSHSSNSCQLIVQQLLADRLTAVVFTSKIFYETFCVA